MGASEEMFEAVKAGDVTKLNELLESSPALFNTRTEAGVSVLQMATYHGRREIVNFLIARGAQMSLFEAAAVGHQERVTALLNEQPGLINSQAADGFTALGLAAFFGHRQVVDLLLTHGADVNIPSQNAMAVAPLHSAVARQQVTIAAVLLAKGAEVNARQAGGITPLHQAVQSGQLEMVKLLLHYGADPRAQADDGRTPLAMAVDAGNLSVADLLRQLASSVKTQSAVGPA
ncbi:MAG: ankyrin repeat domain-containing protein [Acidobacteria bacterium]|nr:ankyrin repeat domain-containing protein [Acidobacteriota bacterium]MBI3655440.1 ankyrin repeat domain-containing protein [Acidobacteriota bacterium]